MKDGGQADTSKYYQLLVDNTLDMIAVLDVEGRVVFNSPAIKTFLGYEPDELNGRFAFNLIHPDDRKALLDTFSSGVRTPGTVEYFEYRFLHKDGSWRFLESMGTNLLDDPSVKGVVVTSRDITDRKRMEEELKRSEEYFRAVMENALDLIMIQDENAVIKYINRASKRLLGYEPQEMIGRKSLDFIHPEDVSKTAKIISTATQDPDYSPLGEARVKHKDGSWRYLEGIGRNFLDHPAVGGIVTSLRDISDRKRMESELRDRNEELEAFAHTISHDLLSPVAVVEGYAKAALEADAEGRPEAERECLEAIARGARRMSGLINSLLQYAQAGHMDPKACGIDPEEILLEVLIDLEEEVLEKNARVKTATDMPRIEVDDVKLRQVFNNLIANALKHMGDSPDPEVVISATVEGSSATFCVHDNGFGIPSELHERIFEPFRHFSKTESQGLGIGLSTVKRAVKAWGGEVWLESDSGDGAAFYFTAPLAD